MSKRVLDAAFNAVCRLTGMVLRKPWTLTVVPTGCDAEEELQESQPEVFDSGSEGLP